MLTMNEGSNNFIDLPVVDIFAGPGGLGEGFSRAGFKIDLSIEKESVACDTLRIRKFFHLMSKDVEKKDYFRFLRGEISLGHLKESFPEIWLKAENSVLKAELGNADDAPKIYSKIKKIVERHGDFILLGGPPCQAYSIAGRSRRLGIGKEAYSELEIGKSTNEDKKREKARLFYEDERHLLYLEYIKILSKFKPRFFIMENVKGILSAKKAMDTPKDKIFEDIISGLKNPSNILSENNNSKENVYQLRSLSNPPKLDLLNEVIYDPRDFVIRCEDYGVPQKRHRVIILGARSEINIESQFLEKSYKKKTVRDALEKMPKLRSSVSKTTSKDTFDNWANTIRSEYDQLLSGATDKDINLEEIVKSIQSLEKDLTRGSKYIKKKTVRPPKGTLEHWYYDKRNKGWIQHETRSHIASDLARYLFCSAFALKRGRSPKLTEWQGNLDKLKPRHANIEITGVDNKLTTSSHNDRFKVQVWDQPSSTIVSHISKDGHYYIHPDPLQCRSLTVREAARLQTFPDNYFFSGNRTEQYHQVGNAVPPFIAWQIAKLLQRMDTGVIK